MQSNRNKYDKLTTMHLALQNVFSYKFVSDWLTDRLMDWKMDGPIDGISYWDEDMQQEIVWGF